MFKTLATAAVLLAYTQLWAAPPPAFPPAGAIVQGVVIDITDGDTIKFQPKGAPETWKIRMLGIDAPEIQHQNNPEPGQGHWGDEAHAVLRQLVPPGSSVSIHSYGVDSTGNASSAAFYATSTTLTSRWFSWDSRQRT